MARHYSPWLSESEAIASAWLNQDFPPFFPWLLALSGAAHSLIYAHLLVAALGLACLYFYYFLSRRWLKDPLLAVFPLLLFALSPGFLLGLQGILSEPLYLLLVLIFILLYMPDEKKPGTHIVLMGLLLAAILLTRTVGFALCIALLAQAFFSSISKKRIQFQSLHIVIISVSVYFILMAVWGPDKESHYSDVFLDFINGNYDSAVAVESTVFSSQIISLLNSWSTFWIIYWISDYSISHIVILSSLLFSLSGLYLRLQENKYDAWYVLIYIFILFVWPHPGQMVRLLFPVMPILLIYSGYAVQKLVGKTNLSKKHLLPYIFYMLVLAAIFPVHVFIHVRAEMASENQMIPVYEIFRRADLEVANKDLVLQNQMLKDFIHIKSFVSDDEKIMYFLPSYLAILSDRTGVRAPSSIDRENYLSIAKQKGVSYIFLTRLHPRNTQPDFNGLSGAEHFRVGTELVWCSHMQTGGMASCLYRITEPKAEP
jgi:hypothetical protein